ncbi:MAG: hypothetical protein MUC83_11330 [Pirellula sp.]|nr:hypothetical protein [Pirellula sp.]
MPSIAWENELASRKKIGALRGDLNAQREAIPRILFLAERENACSQILSRPFEHLANEGAIHFVTTFEKRHFLAGILYRVLLCDTLFCFRSCSPKALTIARLARRLGKRVVWSTDDDLLSLDSNNPAGGRHARPKIRAATERLISESDLLWLHSSHVEKRLRKLCSSTIVSPVSPPVKPHCVTEKPNGMIRIGHIGDFTHRRELDVLVGAINRLNQRPTSLRWQIDFVGFTPPEVRHHPNVRSIDYINGLDNFHTWLARADWDIGVAPLSSTPFNHGKTDNKYRTFAAFGIAGIYSDTPPYSDVVVNEKNGLLCDFSSDGFFKSIASLMDDSNLRKSVSENAFALVRETHNEARIIENYRRCFAHSGSKTNS